MSKIVIRKHVSLAFLGESYQDAYINFRSIPIGEFEEIRAAMRNNENDLAATFLKPYLQEYFIDGKFPNDEDELEDLAKDDLDGLDAESILECWKGLSGQDIAGAI